LDEKCIQLGLLDQIFKHKVFRSLVTLRSSSEDKRRVKSLELVGHGNVRGVGEIVLDVEVKTINGGVIGWAGIERTGAIPEGIVRSKSLVQELGEVPPILLRGDLVVAGLLVVFTTNAEQNLDALRLAVVDVLLHIVAFTEEVGLDIVLVKIVAFPAVTGKIGTGIAGWALLRSLIHE